MRISDWSSDVCSSDLGDDAAVVESVKAASDVYAPISGEVVEVNSALDDEPALVNSDAEEDGWFFRLRLADASELDGLMNEAAYNKFVAEQCVDAILKRQGLSHAFRHAV